MASTQEVSELVGEQCRVEILPGEIDVFGVGGGDRGERGVGAVDDQRKMVESAEVLPRGRLEVTASDRAHPHSGGHPFGAGHREHEPVEDLKLDDFAATGLLGEQASGEVDDPLREAAIVVGGARKIGILQIEEPPVA